MFCDLVDSTAMSTQLDPEDLRRVLAAYQAACAEMIERFDGHLARYMGDGILVYFGYPRAHEDDARRAVLAALDVIAAVDGLNARVRAPSTACVSPCGSGSTPGWSWPASCPATEQREPFAIFGETPNIAARLQSLAGPNQVVMSAATYGLIRGQFECESLGAQRAQGHSSSRFACTAWCARPGRAAASTRARRSG